MRELFRRDEPGHALLSEPYERDPHDDVRYRLGRSIENFARLPVGGAVSVVVAAPIALVGDAITGPDHLTVGQELGLLAFWVASAFVLYSWWFVLRQDRSERRWRTRFRVEPSDIVEVADAKSVMLDPTSTEADREQALQTLISRGSASVRPTRDC